MYYIKHPSELTWYGVNEMIPVKAGINEYVERHLHLFSPTPTTVLVKNRSEEKPGFEVYSVSLEPDSLDFLDYDYALKITSEQLQPIETIKQIVDLDVLGIKLELTHSTSGTSGTIVSDLEGDAAAAAAFNAIESLILAHACEGLDVTDGAYKHGIEVAVDAIINHYCD